jgi:hypothetical protein
MVQAKHLRAELDRRYHYLVTVTLRKRHSNYPIDTLKEYLSRELYSLPKSEIQFVEKEIKTFLTEHEVLIKEKEKKRMTLERSYLSRIRKK